MWRWQIAEAYELLSDERKRANYDSFGKDSCVEGQNESPTVFVDPHELFRYVHNCSRQLTACM